MTAASRHANPTVATLVTRIDRKLNALSEHVEELASTEFAKQAFTALNNNIDRMAVAVARKDATIGVQAATIQSLESENKRLREYLGSVLFQRRQVQAAPLRVVGDRLEPRWGNACAVNPLPHTDGL